MQGMFELEVPVLNVGYLEGLLLSHTFMKTMMLVVGFFIRPSILLLTYVYL